MMPLNLGDSILLLKFWCNMDNSKLTYTGYVLDTSVDFIWKHWIPTYDTQEDAVGELKDMARVIKSNRFILERANKHYPQYVYQTKEFNRINGLWEENKWVKH